MLAAVGRQAFFTNGNRHDGQHAALWLAKMPRPRGRRRKSEFRTELGLGSCTFNHNFVHCGICVNKGWPRGPWAVVLRAYVVSLEKGDRIRLVDIVGFRAAKTMAVLP